MASLDLLIDGEAGIWHLANDETLSWADFARRVAESCALDSQLIEGVPHQHLGWAAARPANVALISQRGANLPPLAVALSHFAEHAGARLQRPWPETLRTFA
jgi:dTDP-4-dehydrorhamnose reductase